MCAMRQPSWTGTPQMQKDDSKLSSFLLPLAYTKGGNAGISP